MRKVKAFIFAALFASSAHATEKDIKGTYWGHTQLFAADDTTYDIELPGGTTPACFAHRTDVVVKVLTANAIVSCAWVDDPVDLTFTNVNDGEDGCMLTDAAGPSGEGACFTVINDQETERAYPGTVQTGQRVGGICSTSRQAPGGYTVYVPCNDDGACTAAGAGSSCDESLSAADLVKQRQQGCAFLICETNLDNTLIWVGLKK